MGSNTSLCQVHAIHKLHFPDHKLHFPDSFCNVHCILLTMRECLRDIRYHTSWIFSPAKLWSGPQQCWSKGVSMYPHMSNSLSSIAVCFTNQSPEGKDVGELLLSISHHVAEYALEFHTIAAGSGWNDAALKAVFFEDWTQKSSQIWHSAMNRLH